MSSKKKPVKEAHRQTFGNLPILLVRTASSSCREAFSHFLALFRSEYRGNRLKITNRNISDPLNKTTID